MSTCHVTFPITSHIVITSAKTSVIWGPLCPTRARALSSFSAPPTWCTCLTGDPLRNACLVQWLCDTEGSTVVPSASTFGQCCWSETHCEQQGYRARVHSAPTKAMDHSYFSLPWEKSLLAFIESYYYRAARVCQTQWAPVTSQRRWYYYGHCFTDREMAALRSEAICLIYWTQVFLAPSLSS